MKDLIISGHNNELQRALDRYEQGDSSVLERMLKSGALSNKAAEKINMLGGLDFDFLTVKDQLQRSRGLSMSSFASIGEQQRNRGLSMASFAIKGSISPPASDNEGNLQVASNDSSDGIGELEFDGGVGGWEQGNNNRSRSNSTGSKPELVSQQQRSRANSTVSIDLDNFRSSSNSLFSSLIGSEVSILARPWTIGRDDMTSDVTPTTSTVATKSVSTKIGSTNGRSTKDHMYLMTMKWGQANRRQKKPWQTDSLPATTWKIPNLGRAMPSNRGRSRSVRMPLHLIGVHSYVDTPCTTGTQMTKERRRLFQNIQK